MDSFDVGHKADRVGGHRFGDAAQHSLRHVRVVGMHRAVFGHVVKHRHVDTGNLRQVQQQIAAAQTGGFVLLDNQPDFWQQLFAIAERHKVEKLSVGFGVGGGGLSPSENPRVLEAAIESFLPGERHLRQTQHFENVGRAEFVTEAEAEDVVVGEGATGLDGEEGGVALAQFGGKVGGGEVGAIAELAGLGVEDAVENDVAEVGRADFVDFGVRQHPADVGAVPGFVNGSEFVAQIAGGAVDFGGEELFDGDRHGLTRHARGLSVRCL